MSAAVSDKIVPLTRDELQKMLDHSPFIAFLGLKVTEADPANEQLTMTCAMRPPTLSTFNDFTQVSPPV